MLLRLLLTLLLSLVTIPATAAMPCHDGQGAGTMSMPGHHMPAPSQENGQATHFCTGCVPPSAMLATRVIPPTPALAAPLVAGVARLDLGTADPPSVPPPRRP